VLTMYALGSGDGSRDVLVVEELGIGFKLFATGVPPCSERSVLPLESENVGFSSPGSGSPCGLKGCQVGGLAY